ncbi:unnamed protein product [Gadus morhua 'NCC']
MGAARGPAHPRPSTPMGGRGAVDESDVTPAAVVVVVGLLPLYMRTAISGECLPTRRTTSELKTLTDDLSSSPLQRKGEKRPRSLEASPVLDRPPLLNSALPGTPLDDPLHGHRRGVSV